MGPRGRSTKCALPPPQCEPAFFAGEWHLRGNKGGGQGVIASRGRHLPEELPGIPRRDFGTVFIEQDASLGIAQQPCRHIGGSILDPSTTSTASTASVSRGQQVLSNIGCSACHIPTQHSNPAGSSFDPTFSNVAVQPFSDFALHTWGRGLLATFPQGNANGTQFRTAPLWSIDQRFFFLHDGRINNLVSAIEQHASSGSEANQVVQHFNQLSTTNQQALLNFLRSL